ncbi:DUF3907 family protein [Tenuibacillus multivorans]|uniref:Uncharacterized protein n=1 Tax=Tenuibacillus multivorans TaxID=237069 RepID=A0A1H0CYG0_9BACI|nr:DUF3907 family protein [Tenuibacillus multivorans]GEL76115.1 hypothetical protein TMU01_03500 [Tenuibacillus multivorans]SDN62937.1 Protein of unknown function [Tenuibacillus multivorans]
MDTHLLSQAESIQDHLQLIEHELSDFLDFTSVDKILDESKDVEINFIQTIFKEFRYIAVYSGEGKKAINRILMDQRIEETLVDKVYKGIYFKCVNEFFSPHHEVWYEDSRASYRNKFSIDFYTKPGMLIEDTIKKIEPSFHHIRDQLDYLDLS